MSLLHCRHISSALCRDFLQRNDVSPMHINPFLRRCAAYRRFPVQVLFFDVKNRRPRCRLVRTDSSPGVTTMGKGTGHTEQGNAGSRPYTLYSKRGQSLMSDLQKNFYGTKRGALAFKDGELEFKPASDRDHLATPFLRLVPEESGGGHHSDDVLVWQNKQVRLELCGTHSGSSLQQLGHRSFCRVRVTQLRQSIRSKTEPSSALACDAIH